MFDSIKGAYLVQEIIKGNDKYITRSQIVNLIINLPDASRNLSKKKFSQISNLYKEFKIDKTKYLVDYQKYILMCNEIIQEFEKIAPYIYYDGENSKNILPYDPNAALKESKLKELRNVENSISRLDKAYEVNLDGISKVTRSDIISAYKIGSISEDQKEEFINSIEASQQFVKSYQTIRNSSIEMRDSILRELEMLD